MITLRESILATVAYADVFEYPLTEEEIGKWIVKSSKFKPACRQGRVQNSKLKYIAEIKNAGGYFFLKGRRKIVPLRKQRARWVKEKMRVAKRAAKLLRIIPTIKLVGVTGALAMENADQDDDIDVYIVTAAGTLWTTRFFATTLLELFGLRRRPGDTLLRNKICLNMYVDEDHLAVPKNERDLFSAHEVLQMKPKWEGGGTYWKFLQANHWVKKFLPNAWEDVWGRKKEKGKRKKEKGIGSFITLPFIERFAKLIQLWYMRHRRSTEVVTDTLIRFHPRDAREWVRDAYRTVLARYKMPLDKIFYAR